jgi:aerobic-type carbon monoxide dehydrogenase small subunit (CoxS/CutS family)
VYDIISLITTLGTFMINLSVNGKQHSVDVDAATPLLWAIREQLGLTGTKYGCGVAQCGACTVLINGQPQRSCVYPVSAVGKQKVERCRNAAIANRE